MDKRNLFDRLFPVKYNFFEMLERQARINRQGVQELYNWLNSGLEHESDKLIQYVKEADEVRKNLERDLIGAFSTPFDRGDIYSISVAMDKIIEYAQSTLLSMKAFDVVPNEIIIGMTGKLTEGADIFAEAVGKLNRSPEKSEQFIPAIRETHIAVEQLYRGGMAVVFKGGDPMNALRQREVYHHIKDASANLEDSVDILHRIIVRLT
ncbi:MAG: DUF47 family protein [Clostridiales bacterium]|nr:DUF47 family protein [Clostridiales bacterium]